MHRRYRAAQILYSYKKGSIPFPKNRCACKTAFVFAAAQYWLRQNLPFQYPQAKYNGDVKCSEPDYLSRIEKAIPYAAHCHLEDILGNVHHHLILGEGDMDFQTIFRLMELHGYGGYLSVELYPQVGMWKDALYRSIRHITKILAQNRDRPEVQG